MDFGNTSQGSNLNVPQIIKKAGPAKQGSAANVKKTPVPTQAEVADKARQAAGKQRDVGQDLFTSRETAKVIDHKQLNQPAIKSTGTPSETDKSETPEKAEATIFEKAAAKAKEKMAQLSVDQDQAKETKQPAKQATQQAQSPVAQLAAQFLKGGRAELVQKINTYAAGGAKKALAAKAALDNGTDIPDNLLAQYAAESAGELGLVTDALDKPKAKKINEFAKSVDAETDRGTKEEGTLAAQGEISFNLANGLTGGLSNQVKWQAPMAAIRQEARDADSISKLKAAENVSQQELDSIIAKQKSGETLTSGEALVLSVQTGQRQSAPMFVAQNTKQKVFQEKTNNVRNALRSATPWDVSQVLTSAKGMGQLASRR